MTAPDSSDTTSRYFLEKNQFKKHFSVCVCDFTVHFYKNAIMFYKVFT